MLLVTYRYLTINIARYISRVEISSVRRSAIRHVIELQKIILLQYMYTVDQVLF